MRKAIALLVVWGKEISQCTDNKGDRPLGFDMGKAIALLVISGKRAIALLSKQKLKQLVPVNTWATVNSVAKIF